MTVDEILSFWCLNSGTTTAQVWATNALIFANIVYHELEECIRNDVNEDYFYDYFTTDFVTNQNEYVLEEQSGTNIGINKILSVGAKYTANETEYKPITPFGTGSLSNTEEYLEANQPNTAPFYTVKDNSLFIYPYPLETVDNGLRVHASINLVDLLSWGAETTVKIPRNFHFVIGLGMKRYINNSRSLDGTGISQNGDKDFELGKQRLIEYLKNRTLVPMEQDLPNLTAIQW